jgi:hypothetical protein
MRIVELAALLAVACAAPDAMPELARSATPTDRFWALVESARAGGDDCWRVSRRLTNTLAKLPPASIAEFGTELSARMAESYRWDLWAVAYVANGGASDDGFDYFRGWLLTRGRARFELALRDPPAAVVGASRLRDLECEEMLGVAYDAYERVTRAPLPRSTVPWPDKPAGTPWAEETIERVYPGLTARVEAR